MVIRRKGYEVFQTGLLQYSDLSEGKNMSCLRCPHLDRSKKRTVSGCYQYGCSASLDGYISTWINKDELLARISCNLEDKSEGIKQMDIFEIWPEL